MVFTISQNEISSQLERVAGVRVSSQWLTACLAHLRETNEPETADAVLYQVLHSDLRDVVDRNNDNGILRQALSQHHAILPENFCLMVQVEELLDVSLNAEARLQVGPASPTAPTPVGNQRMRCLKLYLSDGYKHTGQHLVGMEVSPLQDLSVNSKAGIKVVLRGPFTCRFGIIMCHPGNANVLGGCVGSLIDIQRKALEQAKRVAGVGIDPTVKALIWNPVGADDDGEQDEGEGESGDVQANPPPPPPPARNLPPPPMPPTVPTQRAPLIMAPPPRQQQQPRSVSSNPYSSSRNVSSSMSSSRPMSAATGATNDVVDLSLDEPMEEADEALDIITPTNASSVPRPPMTAAAVPHAAPSQDTSFSSVSHNSMDVEPLSFAELKALVERLQMDPNIYRQYEKKVFEVPCKMIGHHQNFDIDKRKKKKSERVNKDDKYERYYVMTVHMGGTEPANGTILCSVASDILTAYFEMEASAMRNLQKSDPDRCKRIVQEKGLKIKASLVVLANWKLKLLQSVADFFDGKAKNGDKPILQLIRRE